MSDPDPNQPNRAGDTSLRKPFSARVGDQEGDLEGERHSSGINLTLAYSLLAVALLGAFVVALFIVLPFYHRH